MKIGELAVATGTNPSTIRFYERRGLLPRPSRTRSGYRQYDNDARHRIAFVQAGQAIGLTLAELREIIDFREQGIVPCTHVTSLMASHEQQISRRIDELQALHTELHRLIERARDLDPAACPPEQVCHVIPHHT